MADEQRILDIIDGLEENFTEQEAYRIYIEFCFRFIPRIEHKIPENLRAHLEVAEGYWHAGNVSPQALENARVLIWKYLDSRNLTYAPLRKSAAIRFMHQLFWDKANTDIWDHFDWCRELLPHVGYKNHTILQELEYVLSKATREGFAA